MLIRMPSSITTDGDLVPGGDLRNRGNNWLRSAYKEAGIAKVPRENKFRLIVQKLMKRNRFGFSILKYIDLRKSWILSLQCDGQSLEMKHGPSVHILVYLRMSFDPRRQRRMGEKTGDFSWLLFTLNSVQQWSSLMKLMDRAYNCNNYVSTHFSNIRILVFDSVILSWFPEAFLCHDVLLKHSKSGRRGFQYFSPSSKPASHGLLVHSISILVPIDSTNYFGLDDWNWSYLRSSMDQLETLQMDAGEVPPLEFEDMSLGVIIWHIWYSMT